MKIIIFLLSLCFTISAMGQNAGDVDPTFNIGTGFTGIHADAKDVVELPNQKLLVIGDFTSYDGRIANRIIRLNSDGSVDESFQTGNGFNRSVNTVAIQTDGKILVGGGFSSYKGITANFIVRLNEDGTIDNSFQTGSAFGIYTSDIVNTIKLQSDGKILVGGGFLSYNGTTANRIVRLNIDGTMDTSFNSGTGFDNGRQEIWEINIQPDNKILVGGEFSRYNGAVANNIIRLNENGTVDETFDNGLGFDNLVKSITIQEDKKLLIGGEFSSYNNSMAKNLIRLNSDGTVDLNFNTGEGFSIDKTDRLGSKNLSVFSVVVESDGKILVGGFFDDYNGIPANRIVRLNADGSVDFSYKVGEGFPGKYSDVVLIKKYGDKVFVGGNFTSYNGTPINRIVKLNSDGSMDPSFNPGKGLHYTSIIHAIGVQEDGKIIIGGEFAFFNGIPNGNHLLRLNPDGTIDSSFSTGSGFYPYPVNALAIQPDGKIIVVGQFYSYNGTNSHSIIRLNSDGSIDASFEGDPEVSSLVLDIALQADGKIVIAGFFPSKVIRLNTDGSKDASFNIGVGIDGFVRKVVIQSDGKILAGGRMTSHSGHKNIIRLNSNGSVDDTFLIGSGFNSDVYSIVFQEDKKILIGGSFSSYDGSPANKIIRLNTNGSLDNNGWYGGGHVLNLDIDFNHNIIVTERNRIYRLKPDLTLDNSFNIGYSDNTINTSIIQSDGKILSGGWFQKYNETQSFGLIRLLASTMDTDGDGVLNDKDLCPNTSEGAEIDENGCFILPTNNFTISVKSETCQGKNNGELKIKANKNYNYIATINNTTYEFINDLSLPNLAPGTYDICISVTGEPYKQCFNATISAGMTISGRASINSNKASIAIENGTAPFNVYINGKQILRTTFTSFNLDVTHGDLIEVYTDMACEGVFTKIINLFDKILVRPNPTKGPFEIALPITLNEIKIELFTTNSQLISGKVYPVVNGKVQLDISDLTSGIYLAKVFLETPVSLKIIKQ